MSNREVRLEPVTDGNLDLVLGLAYTSFSPHYEIPTTPDAAKDWLEMIDKLRAQDASNEFIAFDAAETTQLVGIGQVINSLGRLTMGYLVEQGSRHQGYGRAIARALFTYAVEAFPRKRTIEADVHPGNPQSQAIISSMGFMPLNRRNRYGEEAYRRPLRPLNS